MSDQKIEAMQRALWALKDTAKVSVSEAFQVSSHTIDAYRRGAGLNMNPLARDLFTDPDVVELAENIAERIRIIFDADEDIDNRISDIAVDHLSGTFAAQDGDEQGEEAILEGLSGLRGAHPRSCRVHLSTSHHANPRHRRLAARRTGRRMMILDVRFPSDLECEKEIEDLLGPEVYASSAGTWLGSERPMRDVQYDIGDDTDTVLLEEAMNKLVTTYNNELEYSIYDDEEDDDDD
jgi:hypothetical protein